MSTFHSGCDGRVTINGVEVPISVWNVNPGIRIAEGENSMSNGFVQREACGGKTSTLGFTVWDDFDSNMFGPTLGLTVGAEVTNVKLYKRALTSLFWTFPKAIVTATPQTANHTGTEFLDVAFSLVSDGPYMYPGGITP